jgi:hypothetical protein
MKRIRTTKEAAGYGVPLSITIIAPEAKPVRITADEADAATDVGDIAAQIVKTLEEKARKLDVRNYVDDDLFDDPAFKMIGLLEDEARMVPALARLIGAHELEPKHRDLLLGCLETRFPALGEPAWQRLRERLTGT